MAVVENKSQPFLVHLCSFPVFYALTHRFWIPLYQMLFKLELNQSHGSIICLSFVHPGVPCVPGQWTDYPGLLVVHQWPVHLPGGGEGGVRASHRSAV